MTSLPQEIPVKSIRPGPWQVRTEAKDLALEELADSIRAVGLINPIVVRPIASSKKVAGHWQVVAGHRRLAAAKEVGLERVRALVLDGVTDGQVAAIAHAENAERLNLRPLEEGEAVARTVDLAGSVEAAAEILGKPAGWVALRSRLRDLSPAWRTAIAKREDLVALSAAHLEVIARLPAEEQDAVLSEQLWSNLTGVSLKTLRGLVEKGMRRLSSAPWDVKAFTHADVPTCVECPKQTGAVARLFPEDKKDARCLDRACWKERAASFVERRFAEAMVAKVELVPLRSKYQASKDASALERRSLSAWAVEKTKRRGWREHHGIVIDGPEAGTLVTFYEEPEAKKKPGAKKGDLRTTSGEDRLERRRAKRVTELLQKRLGPWGDDGVPDADLPIGARIIEAAAMFGTESGDGYFVHEQHGEEKQRARWKPVARTDVVLWRRVAPVLRKRIAWTPPKDHAPVLLECRLLCDFVGWSFDELVAQAADALPEPKAKT